MRRPGTAARLGAPTRPAPSGARAALPCSGTARSPKALRPPGPAARILGLRAGIDAAPRPEHTSRHGRPLHRRREGSQRRTRRSRFACGRARSTSSSGSSTCSARARRSACAIEQDRPPSMILFGPPGIGKTTIARIVAERTGAAFEELSAVSARVDDVRGIIAARARPARRERPPHDPLHRRDPSLQQGAAGLGAARGRGRARDADRRDDGEPVLRGQLGAPLALHGDRARSRSRRRTSSRRLSGERAPLETEIVPTTSRR